MIILHIFPPDHLRCTDIYFCLLKEQEIGQFKTLWIPILLHLFVWYDKTYLKISIIWLTPLNKITYHFRNLGFTFIYSFLYKFGLFLWRFFSNRGYFSSSTYLLFWMSHWVLCSLRRNIIPWYGVDFTRINIVSLIVNHNNIHCCVTTVWKAALRY